MNRFVGAALLLVIWFLILAVPSGWASWTDDGTPLCTAPKTQYECQVASDGEGGAIILWEDTRYGDSNIYAQRVSASGTVLWTVNGVNLAGGIAEIGVQVISDGAGGVIAAWEDTLGGIGNSDIYTGRLDASGSVLWSGASICTATGPRWNVKLISDGVGGAIITWEDGRGAGNDIYAQRITSGGDTLWAADGIPISKASNRQQRPNLASDGVGGAIILWEDNRSGNLDIYAQRIDATGTVLWTVDGVPVCAAANVQRGPQIAADGVGGAIMSWDDQRSGILDIHLDIYAQRIDAFGTVQWASNGVPVCTATGPQGLNRIASDGAGGAVVAWLDGRINYPPDIALYTQRVDASGSTQWTTNGVLLCAATVEDMNEDFQLASDGAGGAIAMWQDFRGGDGDVYAQRIDATGAVQWPINGLALSTASGWQELPRIVTDGAGGAIVSWQDNRSGDYDVYVQQIDARGRIGYLLPDIHSVGDVPGDEGGFVNLTWDAPRTDYLSGEITEYTLWRALETPAALAMITNGAAIVSSPATLKEAGADGGGNILRFAPLQGEMFYWELIFTQAAFRLPGYAKAVPTLSDSTATHDGYHFFQVIAHTSDPSVFYVSDPDSGYSLDNLPPVQPQGLVGEQVVSPPALTLRWLSNTELDLAHYAVYRGLTRDFTPDSGSLIGTPIGTTLFDSEWRWYSGYYYKVSALDIHGNESTYALLEPDLVTAVGDLEIPVVTYLSQNFPNPFNPVTTISFGLKNPAAVSLRIFDVSGKLVRILVEERRDVGHFEEVWDGRDSGGVLVASGVYFYRLTAGSFIETKKMVSLK